MAGRHYSPARARARDPMTLMLARTGDR